VYVTRNPSQDVVIKSIAYAETEDEEVLSDVDRQIDIMLKYASGGEGVIKEVLSESGYGQTDGSTGPTSDLEKIVEYLKQNREEGKYGENSGILTEIQEEIESVT
jgi:hypothetical protein